MSEVWNYRKIWETFKTDKDKIISDNNLKKQYVEFIEKWLNIKANSPLLLKERSSWDDEIAIVIYILKEVGEFEKHKEWYDFWKEVFGRDFVVRFEGKKIIINWM